MVIVCAWCEQDGRKALTREMEPDQQRSASHGMCEAHHQAFHAQLHALTAHGRIRHIPRRLSLPNARENRSPITVLYF